MWRAIWVGVTLVSLGYVSSYFLPLGALSLCVCLNSYKLQNNWTLLSRHLYNVIEMPELPDVETIRNELSPHVTGHQFIEVEIFQAGAVQEPSAQEFSQRLTGQTIEETVRRGKYLFFRLSGKETLIIHLRMTGVLLLEPSSQPQKHTVAIFQFDNGLNLHFIDQRRLGLMWLVRDENTVIGKLGPEPLDSSFTADTLHNIASKRNIPIKAMLLDQHAIAGIGNMYGDEALFYAGIHPLRKANALSEDEIKLLHKSIVGALRKGIKNKGASVNTYRLPNGQKGRAQTEFNVAHRRGETCFVCGSTIDWVRIDSRGTCFCPNCQRDNTIFLENTHDKEQSERVA